MKRIIAIFLSLALVLTLLPIFAITASATYDGTGTFSEVTTLGDLEAGSYYVLYGVNDAVNGTYTGAMTASGTTRLGATAVTFSETGTIVDPAASIVWLLGGTTDAWTLYNESAGKYAEITENTTSGFALNAAATTSYTASYSAAHGFFFKSNHASAGGRGISLYLTDYRPYVLSGAKVLRLFKYTPATDGVDFSALNTKVNAAQALLDDTTESVDGTNVSYLNYWATTEQMDALNAALTLAKTYQSGGSSEAATTEDANTAAAALQTAIESFVRALGSDYSAIKTITEAEAAATGDVISVKGYVTYKYGSNNSIDTTIIEDYSGTDGSINGYVIYNAMTDWAIGDYVAIAGTVGAYGGVPQLANVINVTALTAPSGETAPAVQTFANYAAVTTANGDTNELLAEYICIQNVTLPTYGTSNITMTDAAAATFAAYKVPAYNGTLSENTDAVAGDYVNLYGVLSLYNGGLQLRVGANKNYEYVAAQYTLSIDYNNTLGTLTVANAADDTELFADGDTIDRHAQVIITAAATAENYVLDAITVNGTAVASGTTFTIQKDTAIEATYRYERTLSYTITDRGTSTNGTVDEGETITLPACSSVGLYTFVGYMLEDASFSNDQTTAPVLYTDSYTTSVTDAATLSFVAIYSKQASGATAWTAVTAAANVASGEYVIAGNHSDTTYGGPYYLTQEGVKTTPTATALTLTDGVPDGTYATWQIRETATAGQYLVYYVDGENTYYLEATDSTTGIKVVAAATAGAYWSFSDNATYGLLMHFSDGSGRNLAVYINTLSGTSTWRYYKTDANYKISLTLYRAPYRPTQYTAAPSLFAGLTNTLGAQIRANSLTAMRYGAKVDAAVLQAAMTVGETLKLEIGIAPAEYYTASGLNYVSCGEAVWTADMAAATDAETLYGLLTDAGMTLHTFDNEAGSIEFCVAMSGFDKACNSLAGASYRYQLSMLFASRVTCGETTVDGTILTNSVWNIYGFLASPQEDGCTGYSVPYGA